MSLRSDSRRKDKTVTSTVRSAEVAQPGWCGSFTRRFHLYLLTALLVPISVWGQGDTPLPYDLSRFKKVDPSLLTYQETDALKPNLHQPRGLAFAPDGKLYIAGEKELVVLDKNQQETLRVPLSKPATCVAVGSNNLIYVGTKDSVQVYDAEGQKQSDWIGLGDQSMMTSIGVEGGRVYVADAGQRKIFVFDTSGRMMGHIGDKDKKRGYAGFNIPSPYFDLVPLEDGKLWAANTGYQQVERYNVRGERETSWGKSSIRIDGFCGCCNPAHIAMTENGQFITAEKGLIRVKVYDSDGKLNGVVAGPDQFGKNDEIRDMVVDSDGRVFVLQEKLIRVFAPRSK